MKINGKEVTAKKFAFEGCHKIYVIDTPEEEAQALKIRQLNQWFLSFSQEVSNLWTGR